MMKEKVLTNIARTLAKYYRLPITDGQIMDDLLFHPRFPNIESLVHVLKSWNVYSLITELSMDEIREIRPPFIANVNGDNWLLAIERNEGGLFCISDQKRKAFLTAEEFHSRWSGITILLSISNARYDVGLVWTRKIQHWVLVCVASAAFLYWFLLAFREDLIIATVVGFQFAGLCLSCSLMMIELAYNPAASKVCKLNRYFDCTMVLQSGNAAPFRIVSLTALSASLFLSNLALLLFLLHRFTIAEIVNTLILFTGVAGLVGIFTLGYQFSKRRWCVLCVSVTVVVYLNLIFLLIHRDFDLLSLSRHSDYNFRLIGGMSMAYISMAFVVDRTHAFLKKQRDYKVDAKKYLYLKNKPFFIDAILERQQKINCHFATVPANISIGVSHHALNILLVVDLKCPSCRPVYRAVKDLYFIFQSYISLKIVILDGNDVSSVSTSGGSELFNQIDEFLDNHAYSNLFRRASASLGKNTRDLKSFIEINQIRNTPTLYVNGFLWPFLFEVEDLKYYLSGKIYP